MKQKTISDNGLGDPAPGPELPKVSLRYYAWFTLAMLMAELVLFVVYREIGAFRHFSPLLVLALGLGAGLAVYVGFELVRLRGRVNLKLMFALMTIVGIALSMFSEHVSIAVRQRRIVELVSQLGGEVQYHNHGSNDPYWLRTRSGWILPKWIIGVCGREFFQDVWTVSMSGFRDTEISETSLLPLNGIESISVGASSLSDQGTVTLATKIGQLDRLTELCIFEAHVSDETITQLQKLPILKTLIFSNCDFAPDALRQIAHIKSIEFVRMDQCNPKLMDLKKLEGLPNLKTIALYNNGFTKQELSDLQSSLPRISFWHEHATIP